MDGPNDGLTDGHTLLYRCEDASKNDGWLVRGIMLYLNNGGWTDGPTDRHTLL